MKITLDIPDDGWFKMNSNLELKEDEIYLVDANTARVPELCVYKPYYGGFLRILTAKYMKDWNWHDDRFFFESDEVDYIKPIKMATKYTKHAIFDVVEELMHDDDE